MTKIANFQFQITGPNFAPMGNIDESTRVAYSGEVYDVTFTVEASSSQVLFDVTADLGNFDFMAVLASGPSVELEVRIDDGNNNGEVNLVEKLREGVPRILGTDDGLAGDGSAGAFDGTADLIEKVTCYNRHTESVDVRILALT